MFVYSLLLASTILTTGKTLKGAALAVEAYNEYIFTGRVALPESQNYLDMLKEYAALVNFEATDNVTVYLCRSEDYVKCLSENKKRSQTGKSGLMIVESFYRTLGLEPEDTDIYVHLASNVTDVTATIQINTDMILEPYPRRVVLRNDARSYMIGMACNKESVTLLVNDTSATLCVGLESRPSQCASPLTGASEYTVQLPKTVYYYITLMEAAVSEEETKVVLIRRKAAPQLFNTEVTNILQLQQHRLCPVIGHVDFGSEVSFGYTQEIPTAKDSLKMILFNEEGVLDVQNGQIGFLTAHKFLVAGYSDKTVAAAPWADDTTIPTVDAWYVFKKTMLQALEDRPGAVEGSYVLSIQKKLPPIVTTTNTETIVFDSAEAPQLAKTYLAITSTDASFAITDKIGFEGQRSSQINSGHQLLQEIELRQNKLYYVIFDELKGDFAYSPLYGMLENKRIKDSLKSYQRKFYSIQVSQPGQLIITTNTKQTIVVGASPSRTLAYPNADSVSSYEGTQNLTIEITKEFLGESETLFFSVFAEQQIAQLDFTYLTQDAPAVLAELDQTTQIDFAKAMTQNIAIKMPSRPNANYSLVRWVGITAAFAKKPQSGCAVSFQRMVGGKPRSYTQLVYPDNRTFFFVYISPLEAEEFLKLQAVSTCGLSIQFRPTPVHSIATRQVTSMPQKGQQLVIGTPYDPRAGVSLGFIGPTASGKVSLCPQIPIDGFEGSTTNCVDTQVETFRAEPEVIYYLLDSARLTTAQGIVYIVVESDYVPEDEPRGLMVELMPVSFLAGGLPLRTSLAPRETSFAASRRLRSPTQEVFVNVSLVEGEAKLCISEFFDGCDYVFTKSGAYKFDGIDAQVAYFSAVNMVDKATSVQFSIHYAQPLKTGELLQLDCDKRGRWLSLKTFQDGAVLVSAGANNRFSQVELAAAVGEFPGLQGYTTRAVSTGSVSILIQNVTKDSQIHILVLSDEDALMLSATEGTGLHTLGYAHTLPVSLETQQIVMLNSPFNPAGVDIELCTQAARDVEFQACVGQPCHLVPAEDRVILKPQRDVTDQLKLGYNTSVGKIFLSSNAVAGAKALLRGDLIDRRPRVAAGQLRIEKSSADGHVQISGHLASPSTSSITTGISYKAYAVKDGCSARTACGVAAGEQLGVGWVETGIFKLDLTKQLTAEKITINVVAHSNENPLLATAYTPLQVWAGMPIDEHEKPENKNNTWIVWLVLGLLFLGLAIILFICWYFWWRVARLEKEANRQKAGPYTHNIEERPFLDWEEEK